MTYSAYGVNGDAANELYLHRNEDHDLHDGSMGLFKNHITHVVVHIYAIMFFFKYFGIIFTLYDFDSYYQ